MGDKEKADWENANTSFCLHYASEKMYNQHYHIGVLVFLCGPIKLKKLYEVEHRKRFHWMKMEHINTL